MKKLNAYARVLAGYTDTPKAVFAAVAFSLAMRLSEDDPEEAANLINSEWATLNGNGIIPQAPPAHAIRALAAQGGGK